MQAHARYWQDWLAKGHVVAFGLVGDPRGAFGIGIIDFESEADAQAFTDSDPTIQAQQGFAFEVLPMPFGVVRG
ncbi:MAG: YciI family protein [Chloroflexota bacterium]|nr:YciI family protein [Chloroflexota bacterium]